MGKLAQILISKAAVSLPGSCTPLCSPFAALLPGAGVEIGGGWYQCGSFRSCSWASGCVGFIICSLATKTPNFPLGWTTIAGIWLSASCLQLDAKGGQQGVMKITSQPFWGLLERVDRAAMEAESSDPCNVLLGMACRLDVCQSTHCGQSNGNL